MSSTQCSSPHIRKRRSTDLTTTSLPQMSSRVNWSGKWSKSWEPDATDGPDDSNIESGGQDTPMHMTPGRLQMTCTLHSLLWNSGKEIKRWPNNWHISQQPLARKEPTPSPYHS